MGRILHGLPSHPLIPFFTNERSINLAFIASSSDELTIFFCKIGLRFLLTIRFWSIPSQLVSASPRRSINRKAIQRTKNLFFFLAQWLHCHLNSSVRRIHGIRWRT
jgi:hypothetical protein